MKSLRLAALIALAAMTAMAISCKDVVSLGVVPGNAGDDFDAGTSADDAAPPYDGSDTDGEFAFDAALPWDGGDDAWIAPDGGDEGSVFDPDASDAPDDAVLDASDAGAAD